MKIAINGFGRIGRKAMRLAAERGIEIAAINSLSSLAVWTPRYASCLTDSLPPTRGACTARCAVHQRKVAAVAAVFTHVKMAKRCNRYPRAAS